VRRLATEGAAVAFTYSSSEEKSGLPVKQKLRDATRSRLPSVILLDPFEIRKIHQAKLLCPVRLPKAPVVDRIASRSQTCGGM
jgi:hypothetical protein